VLLFLSAWLLGGAGAVLGSMMGAAFGQRALFLGALIGGALSSAGAVRLAEWRGWVQRERRIKVMIGAVLGFVLAAAIAMHTLSSPIGPALGSLLIGLGAVLANGR
jgi:hypothetical protein